MLCVLWRKMDVVFAAVGIVCTKAVVVPSVLALVAVIWVLNLRQTAKFIRVRSLSGIEQQRSQS